MNYIKAILQDSIFKDLIKQNVNLQIKEKLEHRCFRQQIADIDKKIKERKDWLKQNLKTS